MSGPVELSGTPEPDETAELPASEHEGLQDSGRPSPAEETEPQPADPARGESS